VTPTQLLAVPLTLITLTRSLVQTFKGQGRPMMAIEILWTR